MKGGIQYQVAVKKPRENDYATILFREAMIMSQLDHTNIIKLIAVTEDKPEIALELMDLGNLSMALEVSTNQLPKI